MIDLDRITDVLADGVIDGRLTWDEVWTVERVLERAGWMADEVRWHIYESLRQMEREREPRPRRRRAA